MGRTNGGKDRKDRRRKGDRSRNRPSAAMPLPAPAPAQLANQGGHLRPVAPDLIVLLLDEGDRLGRVGALRVGALDALLCQIQGHAQGDVVWRPEARARSTGGEAALVHAVQQLTDAQHVQIGQQRETGLEPGDLAVAQELHEVLRTEIARGEPMAQLALDRLSPCSRATIDSAARSRAAAISCRASALSMRRCRISSHSRRSPIAANQLVDQLVGQRRRRIRRSWIVRSSR